MVLILDAAPVIFLAKINCLPLLAKLFDADIIVAAAVRDELFGPEVPPDEERLLTAFLTTCKIMNISEPEIYARALSFADNCILTLAHKEHADMVLSDDRLLRKLAAIEGFRVVGTLGVLFHTEKKKLLTAKKALSLLDQLVEEHNFRISTRVYETVRKAIVG
jgi:predicted nucleic acid-binding protein